MPSNQSGNESKTVVVDVDLEPEQSLKDSDEAVLSFHDPKQMGTTIDMTEVTEQEAREAGAVACSHCFRDVDCTSYRFQYMSGVGV